MKEKYRTIYRYDFIGIFYKKLKPIYVIIATSYENGKTTCKVEQSVLKFKCIIGIFCREIFRKGV